MDTTRELVTQWMKDGSRLLAQLLNECVRATAALDEAKRKCSKLQEDLAALREENDRFRKERREALDGIAAALRTAGTALSRFSDVPTVMAVSSLTEAGEMAAHAPSVEADVGPPALALPSGPSPRPEEQRAPAPQRVLIVDDEESFRTMLAMHLRGRYEVTTAESGEEALRLLPSARPQLVLLDLRMSGMGGMQAL